MSTAPTQPSQPTQSEPGASQKRYNHRAALNELYKHPLPLAFPGPPAPASASLWTTIFSDAFGKVKAPVFENPHCQGVWDSFSGSVWVKAEVDQDILWRRGNFGKGSLSRSEPSWWRRRVREVTGSDTTLSAEEVTAMRRQERKNFKIARARAAVLSVEAAERALLASSEVEAVEKPKRPGNALFIAPVREQKEAEELGENHEWLQLMPEEIWFLAWAMDCLVVKDPITNAPIPLQALFHLLTFPLLTPTPTPLALTPNIPIRPDHPLLVSYAVYHHYRSLGWVVKAGVKFCVDWLLYKRGVVFTHAEFAIAVLPTYADPLDREDSPHRVHLPYVDGMDWTYFSTINRVNSQVKKTLILCYVTIPPCSPERGGLEFNGGMPESWARYEVREVIVRRWLPSRMR